MSCWPSSTNRRSRSSSSIDGVSEQPPHEATPAVQPLEELLEVRPGATEWSEVSQEKRVGIPRQDAVGAHPPGLEIDVRRRRRRHDVRPVAAPDAGRVADKRHAARAIEVSHVVRRVPRRLRHLELAPAGRQPLVAVQRRDACRRHGQRRRPTAGPCPRRRAGWRWPSASTDRSGAARRARGRTPRSRGSACRERSGRARVVEMDVRQQELTHVAHRYPL